MDQNKKNNKAEFNKKSLYSKLDKIIDRFPGLKKSLEENNVNLRNLDTIRVFAYGSLMREPHYKPSNREDGYLNGYKRDFCCRSLRSGTPKFKGLTLGVDKDEDGLVKGKLLEYKGLKLQELVHMFELLANREIPSVPIYEFKLLKVEQEDGNPVYAITCVADQKSENYVGDALNKRARQQLSKEEQLEVSIARKSLIMATADGPSGTSKSYFDRTLGFDVKQYPITMGTSEEKNLSKINLARKQKLYNEQQYIIRLTNAIEEKRAVLPKVEIARLEKIEIMQWTRFENRLSTLRKAEKEANNIKAPNTRQQDKPSV